MAYSFDEPPALFEGMGPRLVREAKSPAQHAVFLSRTGYRNGDGAPDLLPALPTHPEAGKDWARRKQNHEKN